ncbi:MAG: type II toxin-antitoxin system VapC family toxin [Gammaproteobacteria bacterium]|nr:type II toxin-antitoxin system VapC family toxin [Gammaproteobacteria bacterium]MBU1732760.1 type II toxin-antitoxin system VapC family toxin [Gammaproteobacteria bacterium]MBU1891585.1 type II toxin-antitoxin system VapC family toxin [Gammaproteobacteria bacterium]
MIILDTNVLSALMCSDPDDAVVSWLDEQVPESIWITSITLFEARFGLALLPKGERRQELTARFDDLLVSDFENRVLLFDQPAARQAADLAAQRIHAGRPVDMRDTIIAGIVLARKARIATRNTRHFDDLPGAVINPWDARISPGEK